MMLASNCEFGYSIQKLKDPSPSERTICIAAATVFCGDLLLVICSTVISTLKIIRNTIKTRVELSGFSDS